MDPVTLIVTALAAGAASALQDGASAAVKDAYARLRARVERRFANRPKGELVLAEHEAAPQTWEAPLAAELSAAGAERDVALVAAAQALMRLTDQSFNYNFLGVRGYQAVAAMVAISPLVSISPHQTPRWPMHTLSTFSGSGMIT